MVEITREEKKEFCIRMAKHLPRLRKLLGLSQTEFGERAGCSRKRISLIENGDFTMTWSQFTSFVFVFIINRNTKYYLIENKIIPRKLLQYLQLKDDDIDPDMFLPV